MGWTECFISPHRFVVIIVDIVRVWDEQEAVPPFLALLQVLKEWAREDRLVLQRNLWVKRWAWFKSLLLLEKQGISQDIISNEPISNCVLIPRHPVSIVSLKRAGCIPHYYHKTRPLSDSRPYFCCVSIDCKKQTKLFTSMTHFNVFDHWP